MHDARREVLAAGGGQSGGQDSAMQRRERKSGTPCRRRSRLLSGIRTSLRFRQRTLEHEVKTRAFGVQTGSASHYILSRGVPFGGTLSFPCCGRRGCDRLCDAFSLSDWKFCWMAGASRHWVKG